MAAFSAARALAMAGQCDGIELDVHCTHDGHFVVHHDFTLSSGERIADTQLGNVRDCKLPDGSSIPLLDEVIAATAPLTLYIEVKGLPASADLRLCDVLLDVARQARAQVHAFDHRIIARLAAGGATFPLGVLSRSYPVAPAAQAVAAGASTLWQEAHLIDADLVEGCHAAGVSVIAWTVNDRDDARRLRGLGVDGLCGDWPERLQ